MKVPPRSTEEELESIEVRTKVNGEWFLGYYHHKEKSWWIDFGELTVGHRLIDNDELEEWALVDA